MAATKLILIITVCLLFGISVGAQPKLPYRDVGACPFECCTYREWTANKTTALLARMSDRAPVAFKVKKGEKVTGVTGVVITGKAGVVRALRDTPVGDTTEIIWVKAGEMLYLLTYTGEGYYETWYNGKVFSLAYLDHPALKLVSEPTSVWWIKVKNRRGQIGWTRLPENFDNKDSCG